MSIFWTIILHGHSSCVYQGRQRQADIHIVIIFLYAFPSSELKISPSVLTTQQKNDRLEPYGLSVVFLATSTSYETPARHRYISLNRHLQIVNTLTAMMAANNARWGYQNTTTGQQMAMTVSNEGQGNIMNIDLLAAGKYQPAEEREEPVLWDQTFVPKSFF